jgi:hypothetical protein
MIHSTAGCDSPRITKDGNAKYRPPLLWLLLLILLCGDSIKAQSDVESVQNALRPLTQRFQKVVTALRERFGNNYSDKDLPRRISSELSRLVATRGTLQRQAVELKERAFALESDEKTQEFMAKALESGQKKLDGYKQSYAEDERKLLLEFQLHDKRVLEHKRFPPDSSDRTAVERYNEEVRRLNSWLSRLNDSRRRLLTRRDGVMGRERQLRQEAMDLASRQPYLDIRRQKLTEDVAAFIAGCEKISIRALILAEIVPHSTSGTPDTGKSHRADAGKEVLMSLGSFAGLEILKRMGYSYLSGPGAGVITAADILGAGMDGRTEQLQRKILLIGDYAAALARLKKEGRLRAGDPGYDALRRAMIEAGESMPRSGLGFTFESLGTAKAMVAGLAELAAGYAAKPVRGIGARLARTLPRADRQVLGRTQRRAMTEMIDWNAAWGVSQTGSAAIKEGSGAVRKQMERAVREQRIEESRK